jgi:excisionase family DNA binding protein
MPCHEWWRGELTIKEAADHLGVSDRTIRLLIADGDLTGYRIGKQIRARIRSDLNEIDEHLMRPTRPPESSPRWATQRSAAIRRNREVGAAVENGGPWTEGEPRKPPTGNPLDGESYRYCECGDPAVSHRCGRIFDERIYSPRLSRLSD